MLGKSFSICAWMLLGSMYLYGISLAPVEKGTILGYANFTLLLVGGGVLFHVMVWMYEAPANRAGWWRVLGRLALIFLCGLAVVASVFGAGFKWISPNLGYLIAAFPAFAMIWQSGMAEEELKKLSGKFGEL